MLSATAPNDIMIHVQVWWTAKYLEGKALGIIRKHFGTCLQRPKITTINHSQDNRRPGRDSTPIIPEYKCRALPLGQPVTIVCGCYIQSVHFAGLLDVQNILSADISISLQTEGHSFGDHLISGSVSVTPSSVIEASVALCSVSLWLECVNVRSDCALNTR
jgi:hypothetical protein